MTALYDLRLPNGRLWYEDPDDPLEPPARQAILAPEAAVAYPISVEDMKEVISDELRPILQRISKLLFSKMTRFQVSFDTQEAGGYDEGLEYDYYGDVMDTTYTITFPETVTGTKAVFSRYGNLADAFKSNRTIRAFKLPARAVDAFFATPTVRRFVESEVAAFSGELESEPERYAAGSGVEDRAKAVVYANSEYDVTQTIYRESGEEPQSVVPNVRYALRLGPPTINVTKAGLSGGKITLGVAIAWKVKFYDAAFPWDEDYDRIES